MENPPFNCPYCETVLVIPDGDWYFTCPQCRNRLDLKSQFAFLRGLDAFSEGQDIMQSMSLKKRRMQNPRVTDALASFKEAYSSLQVAFLANLAEEQRSLGVEMMASMSTEFMKWDLVSAFETTYWKLLLVEQNAQAEYDQLKVKLANATGPLRMLVRIRRQARQKQLLKALVDLDRKLRALERQIEFVDVPRARNEKWKP
jgi:hypothetical protein